MLPIVHFRAGVIACLALSAGVAVGETTLISCDLGNAVVVGAADSAGVIPVANWNTPAGFPNFTGIPLKFSDGTPTGATISGSAFAFNATSRVQVNPGDANTKMFNRGVGIATGGGGSVITITGLPTSGSWAHGYSVHVYFAPNAEYEVVQDFRVSVGSATYQGRLDGRVVNYAGAFVQANLASGSAPTPGANYVVFDGLAGGTLTISMFAHGDATPGAVLVTGLQLVAAPLP